MSAQIKTILIFGGTGGIGEAFARRFHAMGKKVIITGRRQERLSSLRKELPGLETYAMDNTDFKALPEHCMKLVSQFPEINTVWINSGIQYMYSFKEQPTSTENIFKEIDTNVTAPVLLARYFIPYLIALGTEANLIITSSGLGFLPRGIFPVYCPTKAFIHSFMVGLRQQLKDTKVNLIEIAPPLVATELDAAHRSPHFPTPMPLQEYTDKTIEIMDGNEAKDLKEVAVGSAVAVVGAWRGSIGSILEKMEIGG